MDWMETIELLRGKHEHYNTAGFPAGYLSMEIYGIVVLVLTAAFILGSGCVDAVVRDSVSGDLHAHYAARMISPSGLGVTNAYQGTRTIPVIRLSRP